MSKSLFRCVGALMLTVLCCLLPAKPALAKSAEALPASSSYGRLYPYWGKTSYQNGYPRRLYGLADERGNVALAPSLTQAESFCADDGQDYLRLCYDTGQRQIVSADGTWVSELYLGNKLFFDGEHLVYNYSEPITGTNGSRPLFNIYAKDGRVILERQEGYASYGYVEGYCLVQKPTQIREPAQFYYIDGAGQPAFGRTFASAWSFKNGVALVCEAPNSGPALIDSDGNYMIEPGLYSSIYYWGDNFYYIGEKDEKIYLIDPQTGQASPLAGTGMYVGDGWQVSQSIDHRELLLSKGEINRTFAVENNESENNRLGFYYAGNDIFVISYWLWSTGNDNSYLLLYDAREDKDLFTLPGRFSAGPVDKAGYIHLSQAQNREMYLHRDTFEILFGDSFEMIQSMDGGRVYQIADNDYLGLRRMDGSWLLRVKSELAGVSGWARDSVGQAITMQLVPEALRGDYQHNISRIEFCDLVAAYVERRTGQAISDYARTHGYSVKSDVFSDTRNKHADCAYALGIVSGVGEGRFDPNGPITREQAAVMLTHLRAALGDDISGAFPTQFADSSQISPWAREGVDYVCTRGMMGGVGENRFDPRNKITREQAIVTFWRMYRS